MKRRKFVKAGAALVVAPNIITSNALGGNGRPAASERLVLAGIGMGGRGRGVLNDFMNQPEVQVIAICDVKTSSLNACLPSVNKKYDNKDCAAYTDYREVLARQDIDMILCGTPDHWHAQITIDACKAGKDVYCEKPLTLTIAEGRKMVNAARRYGRVFTSGSQRVLQDYGKLACAARSGRYGEVTEAYANPGGPGRSCLLPGEPIPPDTIDWDMWLGPAPWAPYHPYRCAGTFGLKGLGFRSWEDYSGGMTTDWGGHKFGGVLHGLGLDHTGPSEIIPPGLEGNELLLLKFANGMKVHHGGAMKYVGENGQDVKPLRDLKVPPGLRWYSNGAKTIVEDFLYCVKTRSTPFQDVEFGHRTATVCHLTNIAYKLNRKLRWDPVKEDFIGDLEASRLIDRPRRGPWQI